MLPIQILFTTAVAGAAWEVLAVLGVVVWSAALLVLVAGDVSHALHRVHRHRPAQPPRRRTESHHVGAGR